MQPIADLIRGLRDGGVELQLLDGQIRMRGPLSSRAAEVESLSSRKDEALAYLATETGAAKTTATAAGIEARNEDALLGSSSVPAFHSVPPHDFGAMLDPQRYTARSNVFDRMIAATEDHFWDPLDSRYLDLDTPFDIAATPLMAESKFLCLSTPTVQSQMPDPADRIRFINRVVWMRLSSLLHGEQGALNLSASLCGILKDQGAQEFAANQVREEARHVTAFSRYIKARWRRPAPCFPALKNFLSEIIQSPDASKKIIGMQIMVEGLAMGSLASLYRDLLDPVGRRLVQLVMTDEAFHHKFGKLWCDLTLPGLTPEDRRRLDAWTSHCLEDFIVKMSPPVELYILTHDFGIDAMRVGREMQEISNGEFTLDSAMGTQESFRVLTKILMDAHLLGAQSRAAYAAYLEVDRYADVDQNNDSIVADGLAYLRGINEGSTLTV